MKAFRYNMYNKERETRQMLEEGIGDIRRQEGTEERVGYGITLSYNL